MTVAKLEQARPLSEPGARKQSGAVARVTPTAEAAHGPLVCVRVWDLVVRSTHWLIVLSMLVLTVTGIYIGRPFLSVSGPAGERFVMGWMKVVHFYAAIVFTLAVLGRIVWMFTGPTHARWYNFLPVSRERRQGLLQTLRFYLFLRRRPPPFVGHNPAAGASYVGVFGLYLVMILTGLGLYAVSAHVESPLRWFAFLSDWFFGVQMARLIHHIVMWLLIGFALHHVYSATLMSVVEKNGTLDSIFSGNKWLPKSLVEQDERERQRRD